ncbi:hypothetical protein [Blastococcus brunescens]|uniref:Uncharacterized protein n=1 Tax=Blastococcus brunescens TaxID=1564165 RepID=A0ABZ1AX66_9ACTN|nr:hypothetical protein [Blastococcus sp. BMG 8361]WRL63161.1 hypothetical protein U6N30_25695 [Blastococcus sp. BMG 8361]
MHHAAAEGPVGWPGDPAPEGGRVGWPGDLTGPAAPSADAAPVVRRAWRRLFGLSRVA